jgi:hypothetical protein
MFFLLMWFANYRSLFCTTELSRFLAIAIVVAKNSSLSVDYYGGDVRRVLG